MAMASGESSTGGQRQTTPATATEHTTPTTGESSRVAGTTPIPTTAAIAAAAAAAAPAAEQPTAGAPETTAPASASKETAVLGTVGTEAPVITASTPAVPAEVPSSAPPPTPATFLPLTTAPASQTQPSGVLPAAHWAQIEEQHDDFDSDVDSAYGEDNASSTASLSASILEYRTVHGRTYHSERGNAQSWNPNDAQHDESMDILHHVSTLMQDGALTMAHIDDNVQRVLDVGCGTGIWAIDFADKYPHTEVIGVDISPSQPQWIPPNLKFEMDDVTQPWTYAANSFDYIHMRWLIGAIPDWYFLFKEVFQTLKPGGIFESKESSCIIQSDDGTVPYGSALDQWGRVFSEAGRKFGRTFQPVEEDIQRKAMEAAGFVDIRVYNMKTTLGPWPADQKHKEIGQYARLALEQDIEGFIMYMWTTIVGWTREEIAVYAAHLRRELRSPQYHAYYPQRVVVGRKP